MQSSENDDMNGYITVPYAQPRKKLYRQIGLFAWLEWYLPPTKVIRAKIASGNLQGKLHLKAVLSKQKLQARQR